MRSITGVLNPSCFSVQLLWYQLLGFLSGEVSPGPLQLAAATGLPVFTFILSKRTARSFRLRRGDRPRHRRRIYSFAIRGSSRVCFRTTAHVFRRTLPSSFLQSSFSELYRSRKFSSFQTRPAFYLKYCTSVKSTSRSTGNRMKLWFCCLTDDAMLRIVTSFYLQLNYHKENGIIETSLPKNISFPN